MAKFELKCLEMVIWSGLEFVRLDLPAMIQTFRGNIVDLDRSTATYIQHYEKLHQNKSKASRVSKERRQLFAGPRHAGFQSRTAVVPKKPITPPNQTDTTPARSVLVGGSVFTAEQVIAERERWAKAISDLAAVTTLFVNNTMSMSPAANTINKQLPTPGTDEALPENEVPEGDDDLNIDESYLAEEISSSDELAQCQLLHYCHVNLCGLSFLDWVGLENHQKANHPVVIVCPLCHDELYDQRTYKRHINTKHATAKTEFKCIIPGCTWSSSNVEAMRGHAIHKHHTQRSVDTYEVNGRYICDRCPANCPNEHTFDEHYQTKNPRCYWQMLHDPSLPSINITVKGHASNKHYSGVS